MSNGSIFSITKVLTSVMSSSDASFNTECHCSSVNEKLESAGNCLDIQDKTRGNGTYRREMNLHWIKALKERYKILFFNTSENKRLRIR